MGMDQELAAMYGTPTAPQEDLSKVAEAEVFAKLAAQNGINLAELSDDQVAQLWNETFGIKEASAEEEPEDNSDELAKQAAAEFQAQREWQEKVAECDKLGRVMAHAYVQELGLINQNLTKQAEDEEKEDEGEKKDPPPFAKKDEEKSEDKEEEKEASAIDHLAIRHAVGMAKEAGFNVEEAARRLDAVLTLGLLGASEKTASARTVDQSIQIRALEYLERAGYPVTWNQ